MKKRILIVGLVAVVLTSAFLLAGPTTTMATPLNVDVGRNSNNTAQVSFATYNSGNAASFYTEYNVYIHEWNETLDAFCVQGVLASNSTQPYELISVPQNLHAAAWVADQFWNNSNWAYGKEDTQIAIWELAMDGPNSIKLNDGNFKYHSGAILSNIQAILSMDFGQPGSNVSWLHNPIGDYNSSGYQDYLVKAPVPEPATMLLLGSGLVGLAAAGRRKFLKK